MTGRIQPAHHAQIDIARFPTAAFDVILRPLQQRRRARRRPMVGKPAGLLTTSRWLSS